MYAESEYGLAAHWLLYAEPARRRRWRMNWRGGLRNAGRAGYRGPADAVGILSRALAARAPDAGEIGAAISARARCCTRRCVGGGGGQCSGRLAWFWRRVACCCARQFNLAGAAARVACTACVARWRPSRLAPGAQIPTDGKRKKHMRAWENERQSTAALHAALAADLHFADWAIAGSRRGGRHSLSDFGGGRPPIHHYGARRRIGAGSRR